MATERAQVEDDHEALPAIVELSPEEWWAYVYGLARDGLGMSGAECLQRLRVGEFGSIIDDPRDYPWVGMLAQLGNGLR